MSLKRKLISACCILALGLVLAWPFRRHVDETAEPYLPSEKPEEVLRASNGDPIASISPQPVNHPSAPQHVTAQMTSTAEVKPLPAPSSGLGSFDLANHPALAHRESDVALESTLPTSTVPGNETRPAYPTVVDSASVDRHTMWRPEVIHIVANGDTLEKLAERYLNDSGRALEIFDLNRDQLSNPHLLPIGVELRVPFDPAHILD